MEDWGYSRTEIEAAIDECVFSERNRAILKRRFFDGIKFEPLAEEFGISVRRAKEIVYKYEKRIRDHICTKSA